MRAPPRRGSGTQRRRRSRDASLVLSLVRGVHSTERSPRRAMCKPHTAGSTRSAQCTFAITRRAISGGARGVSGSTDGLESLTQRVDSDSERGGAPGSRTRPRSARAPLADDAAPRPGVRSRPPPLRTIVEECLEDRFRLSGPASNPTRSAAPGTPLAHSGAVPRPRTGGGTERPSERLLAPEGPSRKRGRGGASNRASAHKLWAPCPLDGLSWAITSAHVSGNGSWTATTRRPSAEE